MRSRLTSFLTLSALTLLVASPAALAQSRNRPGMKKLLMNTFDMSNAIIDVDKLMAPGVPKDGIPALNNPEKTAAVSASFPTMDGRVISVEINGEAVAYPIGILNFHEAANDVVGGVPIVVMYCPLCDSAAVADRRVTTKDGKKMTLEFGISGFLYNSNMVMYDKASNGIWSQVYMRAMTGPIAGTRLTLLPMRVEPFSKFIAAHPNGKVLTTNTGYDRPYDRNPYQGYFDDPNAIFQQFGWRDDLPLKTLGAGIAAGDEAIFVTTAALDEHDGIMTIKTHLGDVTVEHTNAGIATVVDVQGVNIMQAYWHSWSAFHPKTRVVAGAGEVKTDQDNDQEDEEKDDR